MVCWTSVFQLKWPETLQSVCSLLLSFVSIKNVTEQSTDSDPKWSSPESQKPAVTVSKRGCRSICVSMSNVFKSSPQTQASKAAEEEHVLKWLKSSQFFNNSERTRSLIPWWMPSTLEKNMTMNYGLCVLSHVRLQALKTTDDRHKHIPPMVWCLSEISGLFQLCLFHYHLNALVLSRPGATCPWDCKKLHTPKKTQHATN